MKHSKSSLFLMELIIAILFFSLAGTVCIRLFATSHLLSKQTVDQNHAVIQAQNLAECYLATEGDLMQMKTLFPFYRPDTPDDTILLSFDEDWQECNPTLARYTASLVSYPEENGLITADISINSYDPISGTNSESLYTLTVKYHIPRRRNGLAN